MENSELHIENTLLNSYKAFVGSHFLLNIINAIQSDIILKKNKEGFELIQLFNRVYKAAIRTSNAQTQPLSEEVAFLNAYLKLEQTRTSRDVPSLKHSIEDDTVEVPGFVFQSLIENALLLAAEQKQANLDVSLNSDGKQTVLKLGLQPRPRIDFFPKTEAKTQLALNRFNQLVGAGIIDGSLQWHTKDAFLIVQLNH